MTKATSAPRCPSAAASASSRHTVGGKRTTRRRPRLDSDVQFDSTVTRRGGLGVTRTSRIDAEYARESPTSGCALVNNVFTCTSRDVFQSDSTDGTFSGFAGVRIPAGSVIFVRPEFAISKAGEHMRIGGLVSVGASW